MLNKEDAIRTEKKVKEKNRYYIYVFECTGCGKELNVQSSSLKTHSGKCMRCTQLKEPYKYIYNELKFHKKKGKEVTITFEEFTDIIKDAKCHYCDVPLKYDEYSRYWGKTNSRAHHLDRMDNDCGYSKDNVVTCCWDCNRLKSDRFTYNEFIKLSPMLKEIMNERRIKNQ
jgi:hypothetical protein